MQEKMFKRILDKQIQLMFELSSIERRQEYPMESNVMFVDELGLDNLPTFITGDGKYVIEYMVEDIQLKGNKNIEVILMNFIDIVSNNSLGLVFLKDHQVVGSLKEGDMEWTF